jgi:general secretion pathway protein E
MGIRRANVGQTMDSLGLNGAGVQQVFQMAAAQGISVREAAQQIGTVDYLALAKMLSVTSGLSLVETVDLDAIVPELIRPVPLTLARARGLLPMHVVDGQLTVGVGDLAALDSLNDIRLLLGYPVRPVLLPMDLLDKNIGLAWDKASQSASAVLEDVEDEEQEGDSDLILDDPDLLDDPTQAPIIRFVNALLTQAIKDRASDIHIEPFEKELNIRYRVDGVLHNTVRPPYRLKESIVARIKIMAGLNIAEKRLPQDGRIRRRMGGREIDLRVSTVPVRHGERVVMRVLEKGEIFNLEKLGMNPEVLEVWRQLIEKPYGILLVTGPTGSGKSSTLFASLAEINAPDKNILTIEDPIEYELSGLGQVQVNHKINLTFASALRAFLRQDPDVILVGEIRDTETAANAVQASLTGHLVFSTLHTNDASGAFARLLDMGVEPFLVATSLLGVVAQRLVRRLCVDCKEAYQPSTDELRDMELLPTDLKSPVYRAAGCTSCNQSGYRGRCGIFEFLPATDEIKSAIIRNEDSSSLKKIAIRTGMRTLRDDGIQRVLGGITSFDEVMRVTREDDSQEDQ